MVNEVGAEIVLIPHGPELVYGYSDAGAAKDEAGEDNDSLHRNIYRLGQS